MKPIDESWREILELLEVPNTPGLFVLGSFARRVTVYSQQVRALNLVDALAGMGYIHQGSHVAVVGAGFAGLTAAAALVKMGVSVALFDSQRVPLHLQLNCATRYIHPHIYDWPKMDLDEDINAKLPILNWNANTASTVAKEICAAWEKIKTEGPGKVHDGLGKGITSVYFEGDRWRLRTREASTDKAKGEAPQEIHDQTFDLVILAAGFGVEKDDAHSISYWGDIPLTEKVTASHTWMISGAGDGALTDVMRLCIPNCDHEATLRKAITAVKKHAGEGYIGELRTRIDAGETGIDLFKALESKSELIVKELNPRPGQVILNTTKEGIFGTSTKHPLSSTLNRLVTWLMIEEEKIVLESGKIPPNGGVKGQRGAFQIELEAGAKPLIQCQEFLRRHGPEPVVLPKEETEFDTHWLAKAYARPLKRLQQTWKRLYDRREDDPTLLTDWSANAFERLRISPDVRKQPAALLYSAVTLGGESQEHGLAYMVQAVLKKSAIQSQLKEFTGTDPAAEPEVLRLRIEDAVRDPRAFGCAIQSLCRAPVLIVDGSDVTPAMAFLLGLRSVVRRGVTILFRVGSMDVKAWEQLAFNLRELRIVELPSRSSVAAQGPLGLALEEGLRRYGRRPFHYADLPGFNALRNLGSHEEDTSIKTPNEEVLVLCPFERNYDHDLWPLIQRALIDQFCPDTEPGPARRVIDLKSPETLERRLFEAIRRDADCIIDLTFRRPNVFFELGFRLAAHLNGARVIRCEDFKGAIESPDVAPLKSTLDIETLVGAKPYTFIKAAAQSVKAAMCLDRAVWPGGQLSASYAFLVAQRCICTEQEGGGLDVLDLLWHAVESVGGKDRQRQATYPVLYIENPQVRRQTARFLFDGLLGFLLLSDKLHPGQDASKRTVALAELRGFLEEMKLDDAEKSRLKKLITELENHHEA